MQTKVKTYRNDWLAMLEKSGVWYCVTIRNTNGDIHDKVRCDDYHTALDYWRAFNAVAKAGAR